MSHSNALILRLALGLFAAGAMAACGGDSAASGCHYNGDCADGLVCVSGACIAPDTGSGCAGKQACTAADQCASKKCEAGCCAVACASSLDCGTGETCKSGVCAPASGGGCSSTADCVGTPATPFCLVAQKACVACLKTADCGDEIKVCNANRCEIASGRCTRNQDCAASADKRVCDTTAKSCVACLQSLDCPAGSTCGTDHACHAGPSRCTRDADCSSAPATPRCDLETGKCVRCNVDRDCATDGSMICTEAHACENKPVDTKCHADVDCASNPAGHRCRVTDGVCVPCLANADCPGQKCLSNDTCGPLNGCAGSADCQSPTRVCRSNDHVCVECAADGDCPGGRCSNSLCIAATGGCAQESDCLNGSHCRTSDRTCVECLTRDQCGPLEQCSNNACVPGPCGSDAECQLVNASKPRCASGGACVECTGDSQCASGKVCRSGTCVISGCLSDADCSSKLSTPRCETTSHLCVECTADSQCGSGRACRENACVTLMTGCSQDADCAATPATPYCRTDTHACVGCIGDYSCSSGYSCVNNSCTAASGLDGPCGANGTCPTGLTCIQSSNTTIACRASCDLYAANRCANDFRCAFVGFDANGRPTGACVPPGGGEAGAACSASSPCQPDLTCIYDTATSGICRHYCDLQNRVATCPSPNTCQPLVRLDRNNVPRSYGVCFPDTKYLDPCGTDASCNAGQVCAAGVDGNTPLQLTNVCDWPIGTGTATQGCNDDLECKSGFCLSGAPSDYPSSSNSKTGYCQGGCTADADCPSQNGLPGACGNFPFGWADASGQPVTQNVKSCVVQCSNEINCQTDDTCVPAPNAKGTAWLKRCMPGNTANRSHWGGATCTQDNDCWSGVCLKFGTNTTDGFCLGACDPAKSGGCDYPAACAPYGVLQPLPGPDGRFGTSDDLQGKSTICWGSTCLHDADCAGQSADPSKPRVCAADTDPRNSSDVLLTCSPREGSKKGGAVCSTDSECASNWCVTWNYPNKPSQKRCFGACQGTSGQPSADCASVTGATTTCNNQKVYSTSTRNTSICVPVF